MSGCDSMHCGTDYHGGNTQEGCGAKFSWSDAPPYSAEASALGSLDILNGALVLKPPPVAPRKPNADVPRGQGAFHPFVRCSLCGINGINGIRFKCVHCEGFNVCSGCEMAGLSSCHSADHVFKIMYESDFDWSAAPSFPCGVPVRIVRRGDRLPTRDREGMVGEVVAYKPVIRGSIAHRTALAFGGPVWGSYQIRFRETGPRGGGVGDVSAEFVEPLITFNSEVTDLLKGMYRV